MHYVMPMDSFISKDSMFSGLQTWIALNYALGWAGILFCLTSEVGTHSHDNCPEWQRRIFKIRLVLGLVLGYLGSVVIPYLVAGFINLAETLEKLSD